MSRLHDLELRDLLDNEKARKQARRRARDLVRHQATADRSCPMWARLRAAVCSFSPIDCDAHTDGVWLMLKANGHGSRPFGGAKAAVAEEV